MDYISVSSEIIESWDFTQAPVRGLREVYGERSIDDIFQYSDIIWSKGVRKKLSRRKEPFRQRKIVESSTSLILKKTIDRKVVNDFSASSFSDIILPHNPVYGGSDAKYPTAADGKPLIKVTVIPHNPPHPYDEGYPTRPRRHITIPQKPIEKPSDPYDTKNFYLVVAGCKNRKIYELNTRSGKGETCKHEALLNENEYKEYFNANMIKNKRNLTNKNDNLPPEEVPETCTHNCHCQGCQRRSSQDLKPRSNGNNRNGNKIKKSYGRNDSDSYRMEIPSASGKTSGSNRSRTEIAITTTRKGVADLAAPKSRIKITGRLGLTAEDKYVLKCDATLDDKPIATHFQAVGHDAELRGPSVVHTSSIETQRTQLDRCYRPPPKPLRDSSIQTETRYIPCPIYEPPPKKQRDFNIQTDRFIPCSAFDSTFQCQATQINLDRQLPRVCNDDKIVQCCCATATGNSNYISDDSDISLKPCPSPIVIISVYPNQETTDIVTKNKGFSPEDKYTTQIEYGQKGKQKICNNKTKTIKAGARSRSPSPAKVTKKDKETQIKATLTPSKQVCDNIVNPGRKKTKSSNVQTVNVTKTSNTSKKSEQRSKSPTRVPSPGRRKDSPKSKLNSNLSTGTNTDTLLTKKALVDDFTKQIALMDQEKSKAGFMWKAKHNNSNVTVNIDGDNERYNVTFRQGDLDRDLSVRKTNKGILTKHMEVEEHTSLENFLTLRPDEPRKRSHSQTHFLEGNNPEDIRTSSKLKLVDSLEISHRREERTSIGGKTTQTIVKNYNNTCNAVDNEYLAPIKHFHGDECLITDPIERDLEIRALLGIEKGRFKPPERPSSNKACDPLGIENGVSLHCIYQQPRPSQSEAKKSRPKNKMLVSEKVMQDALYCAPEKKASLYQQLVLSKNFQVLLELKQTKKEKPIVLTHQQFDKVRKTICHVLVNSSSGSRHTKMSSLKCSVVSLRKVRPKPKENFVYHYNKEAQTETVGISFSMIQTDTVLGKEDFDLSSKADNEEVMRLINVFTKRDDSSSSDICEPTRKLVEIRSSTDDSKQLIERRESVLSAHHAHTDSKSLSILEQTETRILINSSQSTYFLKPTPVKANNETEFPKRAVSSLEVHYASTSYVRHVKFSSSEIVGDTNPVTRNLEVKESASIHTLFNGHRRSYTPNLGASAYSLCADDGSDCFDTRVQCFDDLNLNLNLNLKPKKPFLRRLISCLVLRASRASNAKILPGPVLNKPSINSSLDSYHINTSLGAVEMSSSIYDTTASFYSNHTILPARRMRRGFFCSVRGFLSRS